MIDIHCHLLYGVDDGPKTLEESVQMLLAAHRQNVHAIILTPHYRHGYFKHDKETIYRHFSSLQQYAHEMGIELYLGTEYHMDSECITNIETGRCLTMADGKYVLAEYSYETPFVQIRKSALELLNYGYECVVAHAERYRCFHTNPEYLRELQDIGIMIQMNADAIMGYEGFSMKRYTRKMLKKGYVDIVASDSHGLEKRACHMEKCMQYIIKKHGIGMAETLFKTNPFMIIKER